MEPQKERFHPPETVNDNDIYVFACNTEGHHFEGDAGWAFKGTSNADYHTNHFYKETLNTSERKGYYAIWAVSKGMHVASNGVGYGVPIQVKVEDRQAAIGNENDAKKAYRVLLKEEFQDFLKQVAEFMDEKTRWIVGPLGLHPDFGGMGWFDPETVAEIWIEALDHKSPPSNLIFSHGVGDAIPELLLNQSSDHDEFVTWIDLPAGSPTQMKAPDFYIGGLPGEESLLGNPWTRWEKSGDLWTAKNFLATRNAIGLYRTFLLSHLTSWPPSRKEQAKKVVTLLKKILDHCRRGPVRLVTVGEPGAVHPDVLIQMLDMRLQNEAYLTDHAAKIQRIAC